MERMKREVAAITGGAGGIGTPRRRRPFPSNGQDGIDDKLAIRCKDFPHVTFIENDDVVEALRPR